jgi:parvulin-like peptidyl-prolyl isomerase
MAKSSPASAAEREEAGSGSDVAAVPNQKTACNMKRKDALLQDDARKANAALSNPSSDSDTEMKTVVEEGARKAEASEINKLKCDLTELKNNLHAMKDSGITRSDQRYRNAVAKLHDLRNQIVQLEYGDLDDL